MGAREVIEVFLYPTRNGFFRARYRARSTDAWSFTMPYRKRWMVWDEIERSLQMNNVRL
jgi:hypothetical protein